MFAMKSQSYSGPGTTPRVDYYAPLIGEDQGFVYIQRSAVNDGDVDVIGSVVVSKEDDDCSAGHCSLIVGGD